MGGNNKQSRRTKNNTRPSSSGRSAELLANSVSHFPAFSAVKEAGFVLHGVSPQDELESSLDTNFQLVLKKMSKKDSTTKLKALLEFAVLIKESNPEAVKAVLAFWPRLYNALATDADHRVREASHNAHYQIVLKVKRNLAPYLKQLMGPWFTSQYDTYAPAASAASQAFQGAFPPNKIQEVIMFCQEEILTYIFDNIINQTPQTLSNLKTVSTEEAEARYERVLISSLKGYCLYLSKLAPEQIKKAEGLNIQIITNSKFWKFVKNKSALVRASWYSVLAMLCQKVPSFLESEGSRVSNAVFSNLDESDPTVLPVVWETALLTMTSIKDWWSYIKIEKVLFPKLWKVLKEGGHGNAAVIYPHLLPFISYLPADIDTSQFYSNFFENFRQGLKHKNVITSKSESYAVSVSFVECIRYIILKNQTDIVFCEKLIKSHLMPVIEWCLTDSNSNYKIVFNQISSLVQYWSRNSSEPDFNNYNKYSDFFWNTLVSLFQGVLMNLEQIHETDEIIHAASMQITLLKSLKHSAKTKKNLKVQFDEEIKEKSKPEQENKEDNLEKSLSFSPSYSTALHEVVYKTCEAYIRLINEKKCKQLIKHLFCLVEDFDSEEFFHHLEKHFTVKSTHASISLYDDLFLNWLKCEELCSKPVIELVFLLLKYSNPKEKKHVLSAFLSDLDDECLYWCIVKALSYPHNEDQLVKGWLNEAKITDFFVKSIDSDKKDDKYLEDFVILFKMAFKKHKEELLMSCEAAKSIFQKFKLCFEHPSDYSFIIDSCAKLVSHIASVLYTDKLLLSYGDDLFLTLLHLQLNDNIKLNYLSEETIAEINNIWEDNVSTFAKHLSQFEFDRLLLAISAIIESKFMLEPNDSSNFEYLSDVMLRFIRAAYKGRPLQVGNFVKLLFERPFISKWEHYISSTCISAEYIKGNLSSPYEKIVIPEDISEKEVLKYFIWSHAKIDLLTKTIDKLEEIDPATADEEPIIFEAFDDSEKLLLSSLYDMVLAASYMENYIMVKYAVDINSYLTQIKTCMDSILGRNKEHLSKLEAALKEQLCKNSFLWLKAAYKFYAEIYKKDLVEAYENLLESLVKCDNKLGILHLIQVFRDHITYDNVQHKFSDVESIIVLRNLLHCNEIDVQIAETFGKLERMRNENIPLFMYNDCNVNWIETQKLIEVVRMCSNLIKSQTTCLSVRHWDFTVISLISWTSNILKAENHFKKVEVESLIVAVAECFVNIENYISSLIETNSNKNFVNEWKDLLSQHTHCDMLKMWLLLTDHFGSSQSKLPIVYIPFFQQFGLAANKCDYNYIFKKNDGSIPKWTKFLKRCFILLKNPNTALQLLGYNMLHLLVPGLLEIDSLAVDTNTPHEKGLIFEQFKVVLIEISEIVNAMLLGFKLGEDSCRVEPFTDGYTYTFAYLLLWDVLLTLCEKSSTELRYQYADWLKDKAFLTKLLNILFQLMPTEILHFTEGKPKLPETTFTRKPILSHTEPYTSEKLENLVCWIYYSALLQLPALVRQWWSGTDVKVSHFVEKVTAAYVSPQLIDNEMTDVMTHGKTFKNMVVKVMQTVREVIARYTVDEAHMELVITLPTNYPLGGPDVHCSRQICGTSHKQWLMQLKKCILYQNGRIWDGLLLWNSNLDKKFDGVEECYICFGVLHAGTYQLPKLSCQTCRKKFHSACLYKWFSTSNKSSCPICRNLF